MSSSPSSPKPVDPYVQAGAQDALNRNTADYNAVLNRTTQGNALGSTGWQITGYDPSTGAPQYSQNTQLAPQFQNQLQQPIDTTGIAGMPGGASTTDDLEATRNSVYDQQMGMLAPEQALQSEGLDSRLGQHGRHHRFTCLEQRTRPAGTRTRRSSVVHARNSAIAAGGQEQSRLFGLGSQSLDTQLAARRAPISEFQALLGPQAGAANAQTPDIAGAFSQQYQGQLNNANANNAANNSNQQALLELASLYAQYR
jgi:hypothetical protein